MAHTESPTTERPRKSAHDWLAAFDRVADPVFVHDDAYRIVYANAAYLEKALPEVAIIGRPYWEVFPRREGPLAECRRVFEHGGEASEDEFVDEDGNVFVSRGYPAGGGSGPLAVHVLFDVTAARREQSRLRRLQQALHQGREVFIVLDAEQRIRYLNPAGERLLGYCAAKLAGQPLERLWSPEGTEDDGVLFARQTSWEGETLVRHEDATLIPVHMHLAVVRGGDDQFDGWVATLRDLRKEKKTRGLLARQAHDLGERLKELRCLSGVAELAARAELPLDELFTETVARLRDAYQYPEVTEARIRFEESTYASPGFVEGLQVQCAPIQIGEEAPGSVEVAYRETRAEEHEGPFLAEERSLINAVADQLAAAVAERRSRAALAEREAFYRTVLADMAVLVCRWRGAGIITYVSDSFCRYFGKAREALIGHPFFDLVPVEEHEAIQRHLQTFTPETPVAAIEVRAFDARGAVRWHRWTTRALFDGAGTVVEYQSTGEDITAEREAVARAESLARFPAENPYPILRIAAGGELLQANPASIPLLEAAEAGAGHLVPDEWLKSVQAALGSGEVGSLELEYRGGRCLFSVVPVADAGYANLYGADVTELRRHEALLSRRAAMEAALSAASRDFIDSAGEAVDAAIERTLAVFGDLAGVDRSYLFLFDHNNERMSNTHEWCRDGIHPEKENLQGLRIAEFESVVIPLFSARQVYIPDVGALSDGGERRSLEAQGIQSLALVALSLDGGVKGFIGFDAVRRKVAWSEEDMRLLHLVADLIGSALTRRRIEDSLLRANRALHTLSACNEALVRAGGEMELLQAVCERVVAVGGYRMAWVGYAQRDNARSVRPMAHAGDDEGYLDTITVTWADEPGGNGPGGTAIRTGKPSVIRFAADDPHFAPWRDEALRRGYRSVAALPLVIGAEVLGFLAINAEQADAFDDAEVSLLQELADDLAFGINSQRTRLAHEQVEAMLKVRDRAIEAARNGILITEPPPGVGIVYANPAFTEITGYALAEVVGRNPSFLAADDKDQPGLHELASAIRRGKEAAVLVRNYRKDRSLFWNELHLAPVLAADGEPSHYVGVINDVTERKRYEEQLEYQANFDPLTGLPNRNLMQDRLNQAIAYAKRHGCLAALIFLDIDRFKMVNDTLGHGYGDELLKSVAGRLSSLLHQSDTVARYGGDEFVVILPDVARPEDVSIVAARLREAGAEPIPLGDQSVQMSLSAGASIYPRDGEDAETLLKNADSAMYRAKELGRNNFQFFTAELNQRLLQRMSLETGLRRALEQNELALHYQPQVDLRSGTVIGVEALLRWQHPEIGPVSPAQFIPLAEETGLIVPIGRWVLRTACQQAAQWRRAGLPAVSVAVNVSVRQLLHDDVVRIVREALEESGLDPSGLEIELTESAMMEHPDEMAAVLRELKSIGVQLALDDFGTGYSSLSYLHRFPFDKLKIDKSFVHDITVNPHNAAIVLSIVSLARGLGLTVIAEGVENAAQLGYLRHHGCDQMQGYLFSRPVPPDEAEPLFASRLDLGDGVEESQPTLLLVDDEPNITRALRRLFRGEGYRILIANTPVEALELLALHKVQVMVCDQRMPEMTGTELLSRVKRLYPSIIRIILSGYTELKTVTEAVNHGWVYKFLTKPWEEDELKNQVRDAFCEYERNRETAWSER